MKKQKVKTEKNNKKTVKDKLTNMRTTVNPTWCPGCFNFMILAGFEKFLQEQIKAGKKKEDFAIVSGIGCHGKIFDYVNLPGINALHGRGIPVSIGMKLAKPELNIFEFAGDGDAYAEGIEHLIHAARYNANFKLIVHNNQVFALTVAEPSPVTERGYKDKTNPVGVKLKPLNPIKLMLAAGASFVARVFADVNQIQQVLQEAQKHKGFAFIEVIQPCIIFHPDANYKAHTYNLQDSKHDKTNLKLAMEKAEEFDYDVLKSSTKIPLGIFYQKERETFEDIA
jgi:2-oxoglutarate ferredoxin oxidoreductase subunit beta